MPLLQGSYEFIVITCLGCGRGNMGDIATQNSTKTSGGMISASYRIHEGEIRGGRTLCSLM